MTSSHHIAGHQLTLLRSGAEFFPSLLAAIAAAKSSIYLETYIFTADESGLRVLEALKHAAQRHVKVHVILDGFGSAALPETIIQSLTAAGVKLLWFRRERQFFALRRKRLRRLHRKLVLVDNQVAFVGGINIEDDQPPALSAPRLDYAVRVEGPVNAEIYLTMRRLWLLVSWASLLRRQQRVAWPKSGDIVAGQQLRLLLRDNLQHRRDIEHAYLNAIGAAKNEIIIANAYFLPGRKFRRALYEAHQRGVRVVLLLQGRVEYRLQHYATLALYDDLLRNGIEIYQYQRSFLHAKVAVIDQHWATVGSSNIDPFSLWLAREANLEMYDAHFAQALREDLLCEMTRGADKIEFSSWQKRNFLSHFLLMLSYGMVRILVGLAGYAADHDDY